MNISASYHVVVTSPTISYITCLKGNESTGLRRTRAGDATTSGPRVPEAKLTHREIVYFDSDDDERASWIPLIFLCGLQVRPGGAMVDAGVVRECSVDASFRDQCSYFRRTKALSWDPLKPSARLDRINWHHAPPDG